MALLSPEDAKAVAEQFEENLQRPVKMVSPPAKMTACTATKSNH